MFQDDGFSVQSNKSSRHNVLVLLTGFIVVLSVNSSVFAQQDSFDFLDQQRLNSNLIVNLFLENVNRGEIDIFGHVLTESDLEKRHVSYIHNLKDSSISVSIHFKLKIKINVPKFEMYYVDAVSVDLYESGEIKKIRTHVKPYESAN